jgi:putative ABC transport system ATP-binding protein
MSRDSPNPEVDWLKVKTMRNYLSLEKLIPLNPKTNHKELLRSNGKDEDSILQTVALTKHYQMGEVTVKALQDVNLRIHKGEFVAIMGPSGSGKSTLLHLMGGLDYPTSGDVYLAGQALSQLSDNEITRVRRRKVGFIFQFYNLLPTLTVTENIALPLLIDGQSLEQYRQRLNSLLGLVNLEDRAGHRPDQLSGGQQQRVAIVRALINNPEIVLADEPTGNLDSKTGTGILELLQRSCLELGATIVMVTHDARAASFASRVLFLKDGQLVYDLRQEDGRFTMERIMHEVTRLEG